MSRYPTLQAAQAAGVSSIGGIPVQAYYNMPSAQRDPRYASSAPSAPGTTPGGLLQEAANMARAGGGGYQAATIGMDDVPVVDPALIRDQNLQPYMNPYTQQVTQNALSDLQRQNMMAQEQNDAAAMQAGAFGGSRHGVMGAETNRAYLDQVAETTGLMNQANFTNAQQMAGRDVGAMNNMGQFNASNMLNTQLANMAAQNGAGQFNSGQGMRAAGLLGNLAGSQFGMQNTANQNLASDGAMQQGLMQQLMNNVQGQFQNWASAPMQSINPITGTLTSLPSQGGTTTTQKNNSVTDLLAAIGSIR